ncbi:MAG: type II toxin-antitoxin system VapC family toxin [Deltaproteobacteria bacterium]|nr:type II toxin-antitoxin system VapC family toxin [Deltaproteobacteria bacterium]
MRALLDTQCWLWMRSAPERLTVRARRFVSAPQTDLFLSAVSIWELAIKMSIGKLRLPEPLSEYVTSRIHDDGIVLLAVQPTHAMRVAELPLHHRDPFDRMLVAQAQVEGLSLVSADRELAKYDVELIRA